MKKPKTLAEANSLFEKVLAALGISAPKAAKAEDEDKEKEKKEYAASEDEDEKDDEPKGEEEDEEKKDDSEGEEDEEEKPDSEDDEEEDKPKEKSKASAISRLTKDLKAANKTIAAQAKEITKLKASSKDLEVRVNAEVARVLSAQGLPALKVGVDTSKGEEAKPGAGLKGRARVEASFRKQFSK
jgi:cytoskeletal protein RodZ